MKDCQHMLELEDGQELTLYEEDCPHCLRATIEAKDKAFDEMTDKFVEKLEAKDAEIERLDRLLLNEAANTGEAEARVKELEEERRLYLGDEMPTRIAALERELSSKDKEVDSLSQQLAEARSASELHKSFHDLVVKERDLARYQFVKLTAAAIDDAREE